MERKMTVKSIPHEYHTITPYITTRDTVEAIEFYKQAFGAVENGRISMDGGSIAHAEIQIGDSKIMLAEESEDWGNLSPQFLNGTPVNLCIYVEDVDNVFAQALAAGAKDQSNKGVENQFYGDRSGSLTDPYGHQWTIMTHLEDVTFDEMQKRADEMFS